MNYYNEIFKPLLEIGILWEKKAQEQIITYYKDRYYVMKECSNNRYDFKLSNKQRYEVKCDFMALKTGNIYIEYEQFNKPSGIKTTKAQFYIIIIPKYYDNICDERDNKDLYIMIDIGLLKDAIYGLQFDIVIQPAKQNNFTGGYIFKIDVLKRLSCEI